MITGGEMYRKASRVLARLEEAVKDGTATDAERERWDTVLGHVLVFDWGEENERRRDLAEALPDIVPARSADPVARAFGEWWARVGTTERWAPDGWRVGLLYWCRDPVEMTEALQAEVERDLIAREIMWQQAA